MPLVTTKEILQDAYRNNYAIGGFGAHNVELIKAVIAGAEKVGAPIILQTTPSTYRYIGMHYLMAIVKAAAANTNVPIALHLDHGENLQQVVECIRNGFTSIMIDASHLQLQENAEIVKQIVEVAHYANIPVEAELGAIGQTLNGDELNEQSYTDADEAKWFVEYTQIDSLAPSFGTAHGNYIKQPRLKFEVLDSILEQVDLPLVMHGASGISETQLVEARKHGIAKVNFSTELKDVFVSEVKHYLNEHQTNDPRKYFIPAREAVTKLVEQKIELIYR